MTRSRAASSLVVVVLAIASAACGRKSLSCVEGQSVACACTDGRSGAQSCQHDGTYAACVCQSPLVPGLPALPSMPVMPSVPTTPPSGPTPPGPTFPFPLPSFPGMPTNPPTGGAATGSSALCTQARACCAAIAADPGLVQIEGLCQMGAWGGAMAASDPQFSAMYCGYVMTSVSGMLSGFAMDAQQHGRPFTYPAACRQTATP